MHHKPTNNIPLFTKGSLLSAASISCFSCGAPIDRKNSTELDQTIISQEYILEKVSALVCHSVQLQESENTRSNDWIFQSGIFVFTSTNTWVGNCSNDANETFDNRYITLIRVDVESGHQEMLELQAGYGDTPFAEWHSTYNLPEGLLPATNDIDKNLQWGN